MKPKNKLQKQALKLSKTLRPLSAKQKQWAKENVIPKFATHSRNRVYCLECNHKFNHLHYPAASILIQVPGLECPSCKCTLQTIRWDRQNGAEDHFAIFSVRKDFQVVRVFCITKKCFLKRKPEYSFIEAARFFIHQSGTLIPITRLTSSFYFGNSSWCAGSNLEVRGNTPTQFHRNSVFTDFIYPHKRILPKIFRNGFTGNLYDLPAQRLFSKILSCPYTETILKANASKLLYYCLNSSQNVKEYWKSIKITLRHNYTIDNPGDWFDYLNLLEFLNLDILNPKYVCPENLKEAHGKAVIKADVKRKKIKRQRQIDEIKTAQQEYQVKKSKYFDLCFKENNITVEPIKHVQDFYSIGELLKHCVFHANYHKKEESLVLAAYIDSTPVETVEVNLSNFEIIQSRGFKNLPTDNTEAIKSLVNRNIKKIASCVNS